MTPEHGATPDPGAESGALSRTGLHRVVMVLGLTQLTSWGVLYYAFPVVAPRIHADTGWSPTILTGAFSASQVVAALVGPMVGRAVDRYGPRTLMTAGSIVAVPALTVIATATTYPTFVVGWLLAGVSMAGALYPPAFTALTVWGGHSRVRAVTTVTLVAGLASTVFAPLAAAFAAGLGWRGTYVALGAILAVTTVPSLWFGLRVPWRPPTTSATKTSAARLRATRRVWASREFLVLTLSMSVVAFCVHAVVINLVPLLTSRGLTTQAAAVALGMGGVGQVAGRVGYLPLVARTNLPSRITSVFAVVASSTLLLALVPGPATVFMGASALAGAARGAFTLVLATVVADRWGASGHGHLNGLLTAPVLLASAVAPFAGTGLATLTGGQTTAFLALAGAAFGAMVLARLGISREASDPRCPA